MDVHKSSMGPKDTNSSYLMHLALISKTIEAWLHSIPMTRGLAECLEAVTELAGMEMESFSKIAPQLDQIPIEQFPSKQNELKVNMAKHNSILLNTPSMTSFNKSPATPNVYLTPLDNMNDGDNPNALHHLSSSTPHMPGIKQCIDLDGFKSPENSSKSILDGKEGQSNKKRGRTPDNHNSTEDEGTNPSPRRSARLSFSANKLRTPSTASDPSEARRVKKQKTQTPANQRGQPFTHHISTALPSPSARITLLTPAVHSRDVSPQRIGDPLILSSHVHTHQHPNLSPSTCLTITRTPVASPVVADKPSSFWNKEIDLYLSESVQNQNVLPSEFSAIHKAAVVLLNALAKGSCSHFDPDELLSNPVTFSSSGEPGIREWCQRSENSQLFTPTEETIWYQSEIFDFVTISTSSPSDELPIHERYLWETMKIFHHPNPRLVERSMHYVLAALVLIGNDANRILPAPEIPHQTSMSCGTRNAVTCWHHFKRLSSLQSDKIVDRKLAYSSGCIEDLDRLIVLIYSMIETFASIWASTTLDEEIAQLKNLIASASSTESAEAFTTRHKELIQTRKQVAVSPKNLPTLVSFLCCGVRGLMIHPKDHHTFGPLRAINFLLVTGDLAKQDQGVEEPIWRRTQSYIVGFMNGVIQSSKDWVPCELNRYHLAKALFLDFSDFFLARDITKIPIPKTRYYKVSQKECT